MKKRLRLRDRFITAYPCLQTILISHCQYICHCSHLLLFSRKTHLQFFKSFGDFLILVGFCTGGGLLSGYVDQEWSTLKSNHLKKLMKSAGFSVPCACMENIQYVPLNKEQLVAFATNNYIRDKKHNILRLGPTSGGKTQAVHLRQLPSENSSGSNASGCRDFLLNLQLPGRAILFRRLAGFSDFTKRNIQMPLWLADLIHRACKQICA